MALIFAGRSRCVLCAELLDASAVGFVPFALKGVPLVDLFSDRAAHHACIRAHPARAQLEQIVLESLGIDGPPSSARASAAIDDETRAQVWFAPATLLVVHAPLMLGFDAPLASVQGMVRAGGFDSVGDYAREVPGMRMQRIRRRGQTWLVLESCDPRVRPGSAVPDEVRRVERVASDAEFARWCGALVACAEWAAARVMLVSPT